MIALRSDKPRPDSASRGRASAAVGFMLAMAALLGWAPDTRGQDSSLPPCPDPGMCFINQEAKDAWAEAQGCRFDDEAPEGDACTEAWRLDEDFLEESEGALVLDGYIPRRNGEILGQSGVTISTGIDLGQQSATGTRGILDDYIAEHGNGGNVDVDALMDRLDPYFGLRRQDAANALAAAPLSVTQAEAELLAEAFKFHFLNQIADQFDAENELGMNFRQLPSEAQTVIMDFAYQYGLSDTAGNIRRTFWGHVYRGEWMQLAEWLDSNPDPYTSRRRREGELLQDAIDNHRIPNTGDPCPGE
ncbi:pesticin C-terminus-like muramidase [Marilutibacter aestuarii]|nr:pesticin C-terminus-like muramidase [Lysobacter aestuarii]